MPALPQLFYWTFQQAGAGGFLQGHLGWVIGQDGYLPFYLKNVGLVAVLAIGGLLAAKGREFSLYVPGLLLFWQISEGSLGLHKLSHQGPGLGHLAAGGAGGVPAQ